MMVQNLYLTGGTKLTSETSNVSSEYTLPSSTASGYSTSSTVAQMNDGSRYTGSGNVDGSYYNWCAARAGTSACYKQTAAEVADGTTSDICPKYWRLPTSAENSYIAARINNIGINAFFAGTDGSVHAPIYAGNYNTNSLSNLGSHVFWWSSTHGSDGAYYLYAGNNTLRTEDGYKYIGISVRCLVAAS